MIRSAASKAMWVGRTTAAVIGLALVLALVLGVATMALAAVPGDPFKLGQLNSINKLSTLVGSASSPMLRVRNDGAGTALHLVVQPGKPPLRVNSTGRVPKLNSDMVDGKHASAFLPEGGTAADADKLDGKDSSEFYAAGSTVADSEKLGGKAPDEFAAAFKRTVVVSPVGTDTQNGTALLDALSGITDASASKPYLLHIEPATYDLGNGSLSMKPFVDIEGSGELNTVITSAVSTGGCNPGTVDGADNAEMRFLTVQNTGTGTGICQVAISNFSTSPRLTHVTAESAGAGLANIGVYNGGSSPTMTDVTATASGGNSNFGVYNGSSSPTIRQSKLSGSSYSLYQEVSPAKVALTQLEGPVSIRFGGTLQCFNNFDQNLAAVTCP